jgi:glycosyltransferase involved in cell wall biosynthesis
VTIPVAFYAPLKSPFHAAPSGDRTMARLLMKALAAGGFEPHLASEVRTFDGQGDRAAQEAVKARSEAEASSLLARYRSLPSAERPRLWFTYHVYYKAPDWIGPHVAASLGIPYAIAEGSRAPRRASGPWSIGHSGAEAALDRADAVFVMTAQDLEALERSRPAAQALVDLPPFIDDDWASAPAAARGERTCPRLLTVAMMRRGDKFASYRILAEALSMLQDVPWALDIVGDGDAQDEVKALFASSDRVRVIGRVEDRDALRRLYDEADLFLWPAVNEAYGMALLEAQARGCPVVAGSFGGVPSVVRAGETGRLTAPGDAAAFAEAVAGLLAEPATRRRLGLGARRFAVEERTLRCAAQRLREGLRPLMRGDAA